MGLCNAIQGALEYSVCIGAPGTAHSRRSCRQLIGTLFACIPFFSFLKAVPSVSWKKTALGARARDLSHLEALNGILDGITQNDVSGRRAAIGAARVLATRSDHHC